MGPLYMTTSWDDGDVLDIKLSQLLDRYGVKGTFYVAKQFRANRLSEDEIRQLGASHEIGAHTLTHPDLRSLSKGEKFEEIAGSKKWLEEVLNKEVEMFCYPSGFYDKNDVAIVRNLGFAGARTAESGYIEPAGNLAEIAPTIQVYPFPFRRINSRQYYWRYLFQPLTQRDPALRRLGVPLINMRSWGSAAKSAFDIARVRGGVFHLWGHSWEVEKYDMWAELEELLKYCRSHSDLKALTNGEMVKILHSLR